MVGGEQIKDKAEMIAKELKITDCTFSNGWFHRFKARHNKLEPGTKNLKKHMSLTSVSMNLLV